MSTSTQPSGSIAMPTPHNYNTKRQKTSHELPAHPSQSPEALQLSVIQQQGLLERFNRLSKFREDRAHSPRGHGLPSSSAADHELLTCQRAAVLQNHCAPPGAYARLATSHATAMGPGHKHGETTAIHMFEQLQERLQQVFYECNQTWHTIATHQGDRKTWQFMAIGMGSPADASQSSTA